MNGIHRKAQKGFGMTDAIIASGLVGASIVSLSDLAGDYTKELRTANTRTEAIAHAEQKLENFRSLVDKQEFEEFVVDSETAETRNARSTELSRSWQVTHQTALYRQATVTVAWSDGEDDNKVMINTLLFAEDPFESGRKLTTLASATIGNLGTIGVDPEDNDLTDIDNNYGDGDDGDQDGPGDLDGDDVTSPPFSIALSGNVDKKKYFDYRKGVSVSGSYGGMCVTGNDKKSYSCTLGPIPSGEAWSGTLTIPVKSGKFLCTNTSLTKLAEDTELDIKIAKKSKDC